MIRRSVVLGVLALVCVSAHSATSGPSVGIMASFGQFDGDDVPAAELGNNFINDNATGFKLYGQYRLNEWLAGEAAYHFTNDFDDRSTSPSLPGNLELSFSGFSLQGLLFVPTTFDEFEAYLKAGYFDFDDEIALDGANLEQSSERGFVGGAGFLVHFTDQLGLRLDYDWFNADVGDLSAVNIGVEYAFGATEEAGVVPATAAPAPPDVAPPPSPSAPPADSDSEGAVNSQE